MTEDPEREPHLRADAPPSVRVELRFPGNGDDVDARHLRARVRIPLEERQVRDAVPAARDVLGEVAVPPLGPADGVRVQAVEDEADAHECRRDLQSPSLEEATNAHRTFTDR